MKLRLCGCAGNAACDLHWRADRQYSSSLVEQRAPHAAASFRRVIGGFAGGVVQPDGPHRARAPHHATLRPDRPGGGAAGGRVPWSAIRARCRASQSPCATDSPECCGARRQSVPRVRWCCRYYRETAATSARSQAYSDSRVARASVSASFTPSSAARAIRKPPSCIGRDGGAGPQARGPVPRPALATTRRAPAPRGPRPLPCYKSSRSFHPAR